MTMKINLLKGVNGLKEVLKELTEDHKGECDCLKCSGRTLQALGTMAPELLAKFKNIEHNREDLQQEIERKLQDFSTKLQREYEPIFDMLYQHEKTVWTAIYAQFGKSEETDDLSINPHSGLISMVVDEDQDDDAPAASQGLIQ